MSWLLDLFKLSDQGYFYTYSALAQSLAALLGIFGVFAIYRLQVQHVRISDILNRIRDFLVSTGPMMHKREAVYHLCEEDLVIDLSRWAKAEVDEKDNVRMMRKIEAVDLMVMLKVAQGREGEIKGRAFPLLAAFAIVTFASLVLIGRAEHFEQNPVFGAWVTLIVFLATAGLLGWMTSFTHFCLRDR
jgi:hypothetical protein